MKMSKYKILKKTSRSILVLMELRVWFMNDIALKMAIAIRMEQREEAYLKEVEELNTTDLEN